MNASTIIVTGAAGFIGTNLVRHLLQDLSVRVVGIDRRVWPHADQRLIRPQDRARFKAVQLDVCDQAAVTQVLADYSPAAVFHLAAESHVDRSIDSSAPFIQSNVVGTHSLLEACRHYHRKPGALESFRVIHVSTDEVYGSLDDDSPAFRIGDSYRPNSPYAASKAASDHLARAWWVTYGLPVIVTNCSNNYGPFQFPDKLIPLMILKALRGEALPVYGRGEQVRDWLHVQDHCVGLHAAWKTGVPGASYLFGGGAERSNIALVELLCAELDRIRPPADRASHRESIAFVPDRPGHDFRYAVDTRQTTAALGWRPARALEDGIRETVRWYVDNLDWAEATMRGSYGGERLGLRTTP